MPLDLRTRALLCVVAAAILWSSGGVLIKELAWHPLAVAGGRSLFATLTILAVLRTFPRRFSKVEILAAVLYAANVILFVVATKLTTAANAIFLQFTSPVYLVLLSGWAVGEPPSRRSIVAAGLMLSGMALFFMDELSPAGSLGIACGALSGVIWAGFTLAMRRQRDGAPVVSVLLGNMIATVVCIPWLFGGGGGEYLDWGLIILLGVLQLGIPYILYSEAIRRLQALEVNLIGFIEPVLNPIWVLLVVGEVPGRFALIGGGIILAVALWEVERIRRTPLLPV